MKTAVLMCGLVVAIGLIVSWYGRDIELPALVLSSSSEKECVAKVLDSYKALDSNSIDLKRTSLNSDKIEDYIVMLSDETTCGSAGCIHELCINSQGAGIELVPFGFAAVSIEPLPTRTNGMHDLSVNSDTDLRLSWTGQRYDLIQ